MTNNTKKNHTVFSIMESLDQGTASIEYSSDPNVILLLGLSGAGKSTLTQYLFGNNSNLISVAKENSWREATSNIKDTGHAILSHTELPDLIIDPETNTTIYNCPGFSDTKDPEHDISGAFFIKAVSDKAKALKFIFVVNYDSVTMGANREEFMTLARHATKMINNISKYNESIALVATKIKDDKSDEQRIDAITDFLQKVRQTLNETNKEPNVQSFIDILLTTSGPDNRNYTKIGFMPKFDTHKKNILSVIHNNTKFTTIDATDVKPVISSNSLNYIDGLVNEVTYQMWINIQNVVQKVQVFYDDLIQNMQDTIRSFNDEDIEIDDDPLTAELFLTKLNTGSGVISEIVKNIKSNITLVELSKYIISSAMSSKVNLSQDLIPNVPTQHESTKVNEVTHQIWANIQNVVQKVQVFYNNLIQNMLNKIHSFNGEKITTDTDLTKAASFFTKLSKGSSVISEVIENIKSKTNLNELSQYIISSAMISEVSLSQNIVTNISTQHEYLQFLLAVHEPKNSFTVDAVSTLFTNLENRLMISINHFHNHVSDVTDQIKNTILSINNNIMNEIQKNFSSFAESNLDNTKIFSLMNSGRSELFKIRDLANDPDITYKCINQIQRTVNHFNFKDTNIKSVDHIIRNTSKLLNQLYFFQTLKNQSDNRKSLKCTAKINRVISYLDDSSKWYGLLIRLFEKLSGYSVQKNIATCYELSQSIMSHKAPARAADVISGSIVEKCFFLNEYNTAGVDNVILDEFKLDALKRIINYTLNNISSYSCDLKSPDHLVMKGHYIKLSDLNNCLQIKNAKLVEIFALKKIFIDVDIDENFSLSIIAPIWEIYGHHEIKLDGKPGDALARRKAAGGSSISNPHGKDGDPGLPGGPAGNFLGVGATFIDSNDLSISADGGRGGPGQDGGDGMDGQDDTECSRWLTEEEYPNKWGCKSWRNFGNDMDEQDDTVCPYSMNDEKYRYNGNCKSLNFSPLNLPDTLYCSVKSNFDGFSIVTMTINPYTLQVTCYPKNNWPFKGKGGDGGNGGKGGVGGFAGQILVVAKNNHSIYMRNQVGKTGSDGKGGAGGKPGNKGKNLVIENVFSRDDIMEKKPSVEKRQMVHFDKSQESHPFGNAGIDGYKAENIKHPVTTLPQFNSGHQSIVNYKTFAHKYSTTNKEDVGLTNFLDFLEKY